MKPTDEQRLRPNGNSPDQLRFKLTTHGNDEYSAVEMQDENSTNETTNEAIYSHLDETVGYVCSAFPSSITHLLNIYVLCNQLNTRFVVMFTFWTSLWLRDNIHDQVACLHACLRAVHRDDEVVNTLVRDCVVTVISIVLSTY